MQAVEIADQRAISPQRLAKTLDVSTKTARGLIRSGEIRAHRVGRQWRIFQKDLERFLTRRANQSAD